MFTFVLIRRSVPVGHYRAPNPGLRSSNTPRVSNVSPQNHCRTYISKSHVTSQKPEEKVNSWPGLSFMVSAKANPRADKCNKPVDRCQCAWVNQKHLRNFTKTSLTGSVYELFYNPCQASISEKSKHEVKDAETWLEEIKLFKSSKTPETRPRFPSLHNYINNISVFTVFTVYLTKTDSNKQPNE